MSAGQGRPSALRPFGSRRYSPPSQVSDDMLKPVLSFSRGPGDIFSAPLDDDAQAENLDADDIALIHLFGPKLPLQKRARALSLVRAPQNDCATPVKPERRPCLRPSPQLQLTAEQVRQLDNLLDDSGDRQAEKAVDNEPACQPANKSQTPLTIDKRRLRKLSAREASAEGQAVTAASKAAATQLWPETLILERDTQKQLQARHWNNSGAAGASSSSSILVATKEAPPQRKTLADIMPFLPRPLQAPLDNTGHLYGFWNFIAQALLGDKADDEILRTFKLGGSIDNLTDVAYARDHITKLYMKTGDLKSAIWNHMLISWFGAGGPNQESHKWLHRVGLAKAYAATSPTDVTNIYTKVTDRVAELGHGKVFDGDSRAVIFRLDPKQQGEKVLQAWFLGVPAIAEAMLAQMAPDKLEQKLRSIFFVGELTAKELFVLLSYVDPHVADTTRHIAVGPGARDGALLVLEGECSAVDEARIRSDDTSAQHGTEVTAPGGESGVPKRRRKSGHRGSERSAGEDGLEAIRRIEQLQAWALEKIPRLNEACQFYRATAPHRCDPLRNCRLIRQHLFDLADVEVMLCFYKNYLKLRQRYGTGPIPAGVCPRGWERRN